ncbi:MAG: hypothetical protein QOH65_81, partial [Methylobacteriaceae bacterium]|nr:hypothetical protein [Methylobacteriaceae bacterium]
MSRDEFKIQNAVTYKAGLHNKMLL